MVNRTDIKSDFKTNKEIISGMFKVDFQLKQKHDMQLRKWKYKCAMAQTWINEI